MMKAGLNAKKDFQVIIYETEKAGALLILRIQIEKTVCRIITDGLNSMYL